ncbi:MAG TPA: TetR/AcrR family transcriptional regulator [Planctomycetota bacterium]|nr:TetR/AcrR family transcriptional regulator [Planctomycetota bacterium]
MARPSRLTEKRRELLPVVAQAFAELGFRRASTAELARRCGVAELILYRLWPDKKAMFLAAIDHVFERSLSAWTMELADRPAGDDALSALIAYESRHHGEHGLYRIVFAGLGECDDPQVRAALRRMYLRFHRFVAGQVEAGGSPPARSRAAGAALPAELAAWGLIGLGTVTNIVHELGLLGAGARQELFQSVARRLATPPSRS